MKKNNPNLIYDFHTHVESYEEFLAYYEQNIIPVINIRNKNEFNRIQEYKKRLINEENQALGMKECISDEFNFLLNTGIHPFDSNRIYENFGNDFEKYIEKSDFLGEIGMDNCWCDIDLNIQKDAFVYSLEVAKKHNKLVVLHTKHMESEIYDIISKYDLNYLVHWYACNEHIDEYINLGCYFTIGPAIMSDKDVRLLVEKCPMDKLLVETDGISALEWLFESKVPTSELRIHLECVIREISKIKNLEYEYVYSKVLSNSTELIKRSKI